MKNLRTKSFILLLLAISACFCCGAEQAQPDLAKTAKIQLSLEKAKEIALSQNPTLAMAQANIASAAAALEKARSSYLPSVDLEGTATRYWDLPSRPVRGIDQYTTYQVGLSASWMIYNGGARYFNNLIAELGGETALQACDDAKRTLLENVAYAFYAVLKSQYSMEIAQQDAEFNQQLHDEAQKKLDAGVSKPSEVLNFEYQVDQANADYITAERTWRNACVVLGQLLAIPQESIWNNIQLVPPAETIINRQDGSVAELLDFAMQHRPDYISAQKNVEIARAAVSVAKAAWQPTISAFGNYYFQRYDSLKFSRRYDRGATYGIQATWNIFNGFATSAAIDSARADLEYKRQQLEKLRLEIDAEIRSNYNALESSRKNLEVQNRLLEIATRIRDLVREEYLGGTTTITRLNEVQTDLTNTQLARSNAYVAVLDNMERLDSSTAKNFTPEAEAKKK